MYKIPQRWEPIYERKPDYMRPNSTCWDCYHPNLNQPSIRSRLGVRTHEVDREHKAFEILTLQSIEYTAFLEKCEGNERVGREPVPGSLATDPLPL